MFHGDPDLDRELRSEIRKTPVRPRTLLLVVVAALLLVFAVMALATPPAAT